ncbi:zinc-binding dehydrogenase [Acetobacter lambici]|uniref:NAD(P)H-quinone oxidoreductase n=1 Tax=Acetobacter lambici TaxID=1332824 RepID=A0ABT1F261_9PROT|nr:NAD(P)H-quinone oxidoreductase [Acetobacter lambici]MCP1243286.1 NAD(P)H-quinone oxidoreductase [Acetobacter lambici]MCP1259275.1 NAD(P)H-quinone oxidoreductase [Acetobacter lambici]NHO57418.1 zinc-binding dehydrogenase [Acetobacter lambici]
MPAAPVVPPSMQAICFTEPGGPEVLHLEALQVPQPGRGEVLVRVMAAGVNRPDLMQRKGLYPPPPGACPRLGLEVAGEVVACGLPQEGTPMPALGSRVCALTNGGGYAQYCLVPAGQCLPWPTGFSAEQAAALPETYFTVWSNLFMPTLPAKGARVLVHGGASGIGTTAIQLVKAFGGQAFATAGTPEKCALCEELGATAINYRTEDFLTRIRELTHDQGVNIILDMIGGAYFNRNLKSLTMDGKLVIIALQGGAKAEQADLARIMTRRLTVTGSSLRPRDSANKARIAHELHEHVWPLLDKGSIKPLIHAVFPLARTDAAHAALEEGNHTGKIVLSVSAD